MKACSSLEQVAAGQAVMLPSGSRGAAPRFLRLLDAKIVSCAGDPSDPDTLVRVAFLRAPRGGAAPPGGRGSPAL